MSQYDILEILKTNKGKFSPRDLSKNLGISSDTVNTNLRRLKSSQLVNYEFNKDKNCYVYWVDNNFKT